MLVAGCYERFLFGFKYSTDETASICDSYKAEPARCGNEAVLTITAPMCRVQASSGPSTTQHTR